MQQQPSSSHWSLQGMACCDSAPQQEVDDTAYAAFEPPPAKFDDPEYNAKILDVWRKLIAEARTQFARRDFAGAEASLKAALEKANHFGQSSGPVATSLLNLAQLYKRNGRAAEAEPLLVRAADVLEQTAGPHNKVTLLCLIDLADVHVQCGNSQAALDQFGDALRRLDVAETNQAHGRVALREVRAGCLYRMAKVSASVGRLDDAEERLRTALGLLEERWGSASARLLAPCVELARVLQAQGQPHEGRRFFERARGLEQLKPSQKAQLDQLGTELGLE